MIFSPEFHTAYVTGDTTFHANLKYDGRLVKHNASETVKQLDYRKI